MQVGVEFRQHRRKMINAAKELGYNEDVVNRIKEAKTEAEISRIMRTARVKGEYEELGVKWVDRVTIKKGSK